MIGGCLISASYPFLADINRKKRTHTDSGQTLYHWEFDRTIPCLVTAFQSTSFKAQGISETFGAEYKDIGFLKMLTADNLGKSIRVSNIRDAKSGEVIYVEMELEGHPPTWYNSNGSTPVLDPFGRVFQYDTLIHRTEVQGGLSV